MNNRVILDASALLALIQREKGWEVVKPLLKDAAMSCINVAEVLTSLKRINILSREAMLSIADFIPSIIPFDLGQAQKVAELQPLAHAKGLSLGDRACIALGIAMQLPIYTADRIWPELNLDGADIRLIR